MQPSLASPRGTPRGTPRSAGSSGVSSAPAAEDGTLAALDRVLEALEGGPPETLRSTETQPEVQEVGEARTSDDEEWVVAFAEHTTLWRSGVTYPNGVPLNFPDFSTLLAPVVAANLQHRSRMRQTIDDAGHLRCALHVYQSCDQEPKGFLKWNNGEVRDFVTAVFQQHALRPPSEGQVFRLYELFDPEKTNRLLPRDCVSLVDALLRLVCVAETTATRSPRASQPPPAADASEAPPREALTHGSSPGDAAGGGDRCPLDTAVSKTRTSDFNPREAVAKLKSMQSQMGTIEELVEALQREGDELRQAAIAKRAPAVELFLRSGGRALAQAAMQRWRASMVEARRASPGSAVEWQRRAQAQFDSRVQELKAHWQEVAAEQARVRAESEEIAARLSGAESAIAAASSQLSRYDLPPLPAAQSDGLGHVKATLQGLLHDVDPTHPPPQLLYGT